MMEFLSVKLQVYSVQTATLLQNDLTTNSFWNMYRKLAILKKKKTSFLRKKSVVNQRLYKVAAL